VIRIRHIVHPGLVDPSSDLFLAQPVTFASMEAAAAFARDCADVRIAAVLYRDERAMPLPDSFLRIPEISRSIADLRPHKVRRKLALLRDILDAGARGSDADYLIYTNVDIALQPFFYRFVARRIEEGYDAFTVNRRTISESRTSVRDLPLMCAETGAPHKGYDCFVFRRALYAEFKLGIVHVGSAGVGRAMLANLVALATRFREFRDLHATFHIGDSCVWRKEEFADYYRENWSEYLAVFGEIEAERGAFDPPVRSFLLDAGDSRFIPDFDAFLINRGRIKPVSAPNVFGEAPRTREELP
jgi:hypothetical protein